MQLDSLDQKRLFRENAKDVVFFVVWRSSATAMCALLRVQLHVLLAIKLEQIDSEKAMRVLGYTRRFHTQHL